MLPTTYPTKSDLQRAAAILRSGGLVAFPTETVYGLGANALDAKAVRRIFSVKGRPSTSPLIIHVHSVEMAREMVVSAWPDMAERLARKFWPGPLSLVLPKLPGIPDEVTAGLPTVGVRIPAHPIAFELIRESDVPVAAPSANRFTQLSPTEARHVREALGDHVDFLLDGGPTQVGIESTVISLAGEVPALLRPGMISVRELEEVIGPISRQDVTANAGPHVSPGMHEKHYSPSTPLFVTDELPAGSGAYIWWNREIALAGKSLQLPGDPAGYAREIYGLLHQLDAQGFDFIAVEPVPATDEWAGIQDRLNRARVRVDSEI